ncbi:MAG: tetratricopeptide repeat protein, partial [Deltaproteobacteria bacterium]|nr:tetratricopeptide repeat protein [Deltaproteobacteria bacterium]
MRTGVQATILIAAIQFAAYGCKGSSASEPVDLETDTGGEVPASGGAAAEVEPGPDGSGGMATATEESPWGATQAEQCRRPARPTMSSKATKSFVAGVSAAASGDAGRAEAEFQAALKRDPNAYPARYNLGVLADRAGNERGAIDEYQRALRILPDYEPAARGISTIQIRRGQVQAAVATVEPLANRYRSNLEMQALYAEVLVEARRYDEAWMAA